MKKPWIMDVKIIKVVDPDMIATPFVFMWNKAPNHKDCTFYKLCPGVEESPNKVTKVPGEDRKVSSLTSGSTLYPVFKPCPVFKPWEEWEKGGRLERLFDWKVENKQKHDITGDEKKEKKEKKKTKKEEKVPSKTARPVHITEKKKKLGGIPKGKGSGWKGSRVILSEVPRARKTRNNKKVRLFVNNPSVTALYGCESAFGNQMVPYHAGRY